MEDAGVAQQQQHTSDMVSSAPEMFLSNLPEFQGLFSKVGQNASLCKLQNHDVHIQMIQSTKKTSFFLNKHSFSNTNRRDTHEGSWGHADTMVHMLDRQKKWQWRCTMLDVQQLHSSSKEKVQKKSTFVLGHVHDQRGVTGRKTSKKEVEWSKQSKKEWLWMIPNQRRRSPDCLQGQIQTVCTNMPTFHENTVFTTGLANGLGGLLSSLLAANFCYRYQSDLLTTAACWPVCVLTHLTYSADFQKCPGWERRRFRLGNFSSKSTSLEKLGRSSGL